MRGNKLGQIYFGQGGKGFKGGEIADERHMMNPKRLCGYGEMAGTETRRSVMAGPPVVIARTARTLVGTGPDGVMICSLGTLNPQTVAPGDILAETECRGRENHDHEE